MLRELTCDEIVEVTGGALIDGPELVAASGEEAVTSVSTDTRSLKPGALFVAIRGEHLDGHQYAANALRLGAGALLVERPIPNASVPQVVVVDTVHALGDIARYVRDAFTGPVIGVTGSVGKTTTKEMIATVLEAQFTVLKSAANHNNEIGVPQTIFDLDSGHTALVLEMGMRGPGQIRRLAEIGAPTIGVVTNVGHSHIELLGSREAIADAKGELFEMLPAEGGVAVYAAEDAFAATLRARFRGETALTCGIDAPAADICATELSQHEGGWRFTVETPWGQTEVFVPSPGRFNVLNALFAVAVGGLLGIPLDAIARALARWMPMPMRLETVRSAAGITILSDAYNAAPDSMVGALETLQATSVAGVGTRIAILGEMRELGAYAEEGHSLVGHAVARTAPGMLILIGPLTQRIAAASRVDGFSQDRIHYFETTEQARQAIPFVVQAGDVVLVKGSRALAMERIVEALP